MASRNSRAGMHGFVGALVLVAASMAGTGCGPGNWSVESEPVDGSVTLLASEDEEAIVLEVDTSYAGRVNVFVSLPGRVKEQPEEDPDLGIPLDGSEEAASGSLVAAELALGDGHSLITLPGVGGRLSVACPGERCSRDEATLSLRVLDNADVPEEGLFLRWEATAETFGEGAATPEDAEASIELER